MTDTSTPAPVGHGVQSGPVGGPLALTVAGALFVLYPAVRPYADETTIAGARAFASLAWVIAHLAAVAGFILLPLGLLALRTTLAPRPKVTSAGAAFLLTWVGVGLTLPYYGAEVFSLNALGDRMARTGDASLLDLVEAIRLGLVQATIFAAGLLLIAAGTVLAAVAVWRSGTMPRWGGVPLAAGSILFVPQFFAPPPLRIAHGVLIGVGCLALATALRSAHRHRRPL